MSPASGTSGGPDKKSGSGPGSPSRPSSAGRNSSARQADDAAAPQTAAAKATKTAAKTTAKAGTKAAGAAKSKANAKTAAKKKTDGVFTGTNAGAKPAATAQKDDPGAPPKPSQPGTSADDAAAAPAEGDGKGGSGDGRPPPGDDGRNGAMPWDRFALYGLAGLAGGVIVALVLLLTNVPGDLQERVSALESRTENLGLAAGDPDQAAALRRRVEALAERIDALANLSGAEPLVRQLSELDVRLEGLAEALDGGEAGAALAARVRERRAELERINEELVRLDTKLAKLAGQVRRTETRLAARLESLEAVTPEDLPERLDRAANKDTVETLLARVARLERDEMTRDVRRAALALALANLTRAVEGSQPFVNELKALKVLEPGNELLAALEPYAESGVPSLPTLAARFDPVANDIVKAWRKAHGKGFVAALWDNILGLFRVRPVGEAEGMDAPAVVARAERRLAEGELYLATRELAKLGEPENEAAQAWLDTAKSRLRLNDLVAELNRKVLEAIAAATAERKKREESFVPSADGTAPEGAPGKDDAHADDSSGTNGAAGDAPEGEISDSQGTQDEDEAHTNASER